MDNERRPTLTRARSVRIDAPIESYFVSWQGGAYIVSWNKTAQGYTIYHEGSRKKIAVVKPVEGLGKEEAITWIEGNC